jgi:nitrogen regulatory protein PII
MKRLEVIANRSVQDELIETLEKAIPGFYYTLVPVVHGRGKRQYRMGTAIWPEENFMLISFLSDECFDTAAQSIGQIKQRFPGEGIKFFPISVEGETK